MDSASVLPQAASGKPIDVKVNTVNIDSVKVNAKVLHAICATNQVTHSNAKRIGDIVRNDVKQVSTMNPIAVPVNAVKVNAAPWQYNTVETLQKELQAKMCLLKTTNLNALPDCGQKLKDQIASLQEEIQLKKTFLARNSELNEQNPHFVSNRPINVQQPQIVKTYNSGPIMQQKQFFKPGDNRYPLQNLNAPRSQPGVVNSNGTYGQQFPNVQRNVQWKPHNFPVQRQAIQIQPMPNAFQMYRAHPQMQTLYGGRMTNERKQKVSLITGDAIHKLHHSLQSCPPPSQMITDPKGLHVSLLPHQRHAIEWMLWREKQDPSGGILADDMGLGKTLTALALVLKARELPPPQMKNPPGMIISNTTLIITPASVLHQWEREAQNRIDSSKLKVLLYHGTKRNKDLENLVSNDVVLTTYNIILSEIGGDEKAATTPEKGFDGSKPKKAKSILDVVWDRVILDEAHTIKNPKARTSIAICKLRAKHRWILTGTPVHNELMDLFSLLRFLRCSPFDELKVWKKWVDDKSDAGQKRLNTLIKSLMLRRLKNELDEKSGKPLVTLPSKTMETVPIKLSPEEKKVYDRVYEVSRTSLMHYLKQQESKLIKGDEAKDTQKDESQKSKAVEAVNVVNRGTDILLVLLRLRQCCSHLSLLKKVDEEVCETVSSDDNLADILGALTLEDKTQGLENNAPLKVVIDTLAANNRFFTKSCASTKIEYVMKKLKEIHFNASSQNVKSVIVSQWTSMLEIVALHLKNAKLRHHLIRGDVPPKVRAAAVDDFNNNPAGPEVMLVSLRAGGVGLNLIGGSHLFLIDMHWNPQLELQACDRIYRVGQTKDVHIYRFLCKDTVEEKILSLQEKKLQLASNIYSGTNEMKKLTLNDIKMLFSI